MHQEYTGRFAPSPTGPLHMGSLVAAVGSYLQARAHGGRWLVRMEDLDKLREIPGAARDILQTLERHGLYPDEPVLFQSSRADAYQAALDKLIKDGLAYPCTCSRKDILTTAQQGHHGLVYPGTCRFGPGNPGKEQHTFRIRTRDHAITFIDARTGSYTQHLESEIGDFIAKRADGYFAYQLAVVVDDAFQGITEIVRGEDLLGSTPRQRYLQALLDYPAPRYLHLPLVTNPQGQKLSKQTHAPALNPQNATSNLFQAIAFLNQNPPENLQGATPETLLAWAVAHWSPHRLQAYSAGTRISP